MFNNFSKNNTNLLKGVAICLLLWHHLFFNYSMISFSEFNITGIIAYYGKVCVAIFIILSGYGLSESFNKKQISFIEFYKKSFTKLYVNYWIIWLIFVPVGVLLFDRTFKVAYGSHILFKFILNIFGLQKIIGIDGYNPTWWFMTLIIVLYFAFPLIKKLMNTRGNLMLIISFLLLFVPTVKIGTSNPMEDFGVWIFPFVLGIYCSNNNLFCKIANVNINKSLKAMVYIIAILSIMLFRKYGIILTSVRIDGIFGLLIIMFSYEYISKIKYVKTGLEFIGIHSFNIFLFHTFLYFYYFKNLIYSLRNPIVIFFVLLFVCLLVSMAIETIKKSIAKYSRKFILKN